MAFIIDDDNRKILDSILPYFEFEQVIDIKRAIRKLMEGQPLALNNLPIGSITDAIKDFLIKYSFAINFSGDALISSRGMALKEAGSLHSFIKTLQKKHDYLVIDDDHLNNRICMSIISNVTSDADIKAFTDPNIALRHIQTNHGIENAKDVIMLLDINMPTLLGWDVLEEFKNLPDGTKRQFKIFMLTSSVNAKDKERAIANPYLWGYIEKPLTKEKVQSILVHDNPFSKRVLPV